MYKPKNIQRNDKDTQNTNKTSASLHSSDDRGQLKQYIKDDQMIKILNKKGINKLFPIQYETYNLIYKEEDVVAKDRTGSGKTLAFSLPIIMRMREKLKFKGNHNPKFLIVLPTRELAIQVKDQIGSLRLKDQQDFNVGAVYGGAGIQEQLDIISRGADIIVGTPGRLIDFLNRGAIRLNDLQCICLDQADEMLKIGFKEEIEKIFQCITKVKSQKVQCLLFSATIPDWIWQISDQYQSKSKKFIDMIKDTNIRTSKTVQHYCIKANPMQKQAFIGSIIKHFFKGKSGKVIIFCQTKREVDRISSSGLIPFSLEKLHGDIKQFQRERVFRKFKSGQIQCLVATNVAARGLDFPQIDLIIQMQPPPTTDTYIHRSGRTGRAGKSGVCVTLYSYKEQHSMKRIQNQTKMILHHMNSSSLTPAKSSQTSNFRAEIDRNQSYNRHSDRNNDRYNDRDRNNDRSNDRYNDRNNDRQSDRYNDRNYDRNNDRNNDRYRNQRSYNKTQSSFSKQRTDPRLEKNHEKQQKKSQTVQEIEY